MFTKAEETAIQESFEELLHNFPPSEHEDDLQLIRKAFNLANEAHKNMRRKSGEPYIMHPIAVARIAALEIGLGTKSVISALLHDVVEDTDYTLDDIRNLFGDKIASIVDGLTKISGVFDNNSSLQAENFRRMLLTLSDDVRVIIIKLADRLHNMRTLDALPQHKQIKIASETIYLFAPLAHRLGLYAIKTEMEDLSLKYTHPKVFEEVSNKLKNSETQRIQQINKFALPIIEALELNKVKFEISGRSKSIYSIWNKMQTKNIPFEEVYDLLAIRIVFDPIPEFPEKAQCWNIYSIITDIYTPRPDRLRDWISTPKANGYEALHVTLMGPGGQWVEVQIRSQRMDEIAERGYAAHWKYKEFTQQESELDKWLKKVREALENPQANALDFMDEFKLNLFASEIIVFTPKGHMKTLPKGSTVLDFAYEIHTGIGNKAIGAKVNHRLVPLNYQLSSGDQIEIITSDKQRSQKQWLEYVTTVKAKSAITDSFKAEVKNRTEKGKAMLEEKLKEFDLTPSSRIIKKLLPAYEVTTKDEFYSKIGSGIIQLDDLKQVLKKNTRNKWIQYWELQFTKKGEEAPEQMTFETYDEKSPFFLRENLDSTESVYRIARCCSPIPGDEVIGHKASGDAIIIHKARCQNALRVMASHAELMVPVKWTTHKILSFLVRINLKGIDRFGVYNNITTVITKELSVNIRTINLESHDGIFEGIIDLYVHNTKDLNSLIQNLCKVKGVEYVTRLDNLET